MKEKFIYKEDPNGNVRFKHLVENGDEAFAILDKDGEERVLYSIETEYEGIVYYDEYGNEKFSYFNEDGKEGITYFDNEREERTIYFNKKYEEKSRWPWLYILSAALAVSLVVLFLVLLSSDLSAKSQQETPIETPAESQVPAETPTEAQPETQAPTEAPAESQPEPQAPAEAPAESQSEANVSDRVKLTGYYYGNICDIPVNTLDSRNNCIEEPYVLPYDGNGSKREVSFTFSEQVKSITRVNRNFDAISEVSSFYLDDKAVTSFEYTMEVPENDPTRDFRYFFKVTTLDDTSYYFGIRYVDPDLL